jgi:hypothetical protein
MIFLLHVNDHFQWEWIFSNEDPHPWHFRHLGGAIAAPLGFFFGGMMVTVWSWQE